MVWFNMEAIPKSGVSKWIDINLHTLKVGILLINLKILTMYLVEIVL